MAAPVHLLVYTSLISPAASLALPETMRSILLVSQAWNRRDGITGLLISDGYWFAQALEGDEAKVEACFTRIERDERNTSPGVRLRRSSTERLFPRWSMCGLTLSEQDDALLPAPDIAASVFHAPPGWVLQLLTSMAERHGAELDAQHEAFAQDR